MGELDPQEILKLAEYIIRQDAASRGGGRGSEPTQSGENIHPYATLSQAVAKLSEAMFRSGKKDGRHEIKNIFPNSTNRSSASVLMNSITHPSRLNTDCFPASIVYTEFPQGSQTTNEATFINIGFYTTRRGIKFPFFEITEGPQYTRIAPDTTPSPAGIALANKAASILRACAQKLGEKAA